MLYYNIFSREIGKNPAEIFGKIKKNRFCTVLFYMQEMLFGEEVAIEYLSVGVGNDPFGFLLPAVGCIRFYQFTCISIVDTDMGKRKCLF